MKSAAALLLATLVVASGLAAAQSGSNSESEDPDDSGSSSSSSSPPSSSSSSASSSPPSSRPPEPCANLAPDEQRACKQEYCREHPGDPRCPRPAANTTKGPGDGARPPEREDDEPAACDIKGNPVYCRERYCEAHGNATFCRHEQGDLRERLKEAAQQRRLGAEVELKRGHGNESVKMLRYDNVTVEVTGTDRLATEADPLTIRLSSELAEGRTFSFTVNASLLPDGDAERLVLRYYDVRDDGARTEVVLAKADSLADVLDTGNDDGQPEYWIVSDANGVQVLLFVPHWSIHELTIAGLGALVQPSVLVGLAAGAVASILLAVALFVPRRRDE